MKNNLIDGVKGVVGGAATGGIIFTGGAIQNTSDGDTIKNCNVGIFFATVKDTANTVKNAQLIKNKVAVMASAAAGALQPNVVQNSKITNSDSLDVNLINGAKLALENVDFDSAKVVVAGTSLLTVRYDLDIAVTKAGTPVQGAAVNVYDGATLVFSGVTDATGHELATLTSYTRTNSGKTFASYKVVTMKAPDTSTVLNVSVSKGAVLTVKSSGVTSVNKVEGIPDQFVLMANYPNPFNPTTTIKYGVPKESKVTLKIYSILGQEVVTLVDGVQAAAYHIVTWNGRTDAGVPLASGVYFLQMQAYPAGGGDSFVQVRKMAIIK